MIIANIAMPGGFLVARYAIHKKAGTKPAHDHCSDLGSKLAFKLGQRLKQISDQTVVGHLKNRGFLVGVDGHDHF